MHTVVTTRVTVAAAPATALLLAALLAGCAGTGSPDRPSPSRSITGSITASIPSPTRSPSRAPSQSASTAPAPSASGTLPGSPSRSRSTSSSEQASPTESSATPSQSSVVGSSSGQPSESAASSAADNPNAEGEAADDGIPSWVWWLLAALCLLAATLTAVLVPRARRRRAWDAALAGNEAEVSWFARELLPVLQRAPDELAGGWHVGVERVSQAEDELTGLSGSSPDSVRRDRAHQLRDAVRAARHRVEELLVSPDRTTIAPALDTISAQLVAALDSRTT